MPSSPKRIRPESLVELTTGVAIRADFESRFETPDAVRWTVHVSTDPRERVPRLVEFCVHFAGTGSPIADLTDDGMRRLVELAVSEEAARAARQRMISGHGVAIGEAFGEHFPDVVVPEGTLVLDGAELRRVRDDATSAVRPKRGRRPIADDEKLRILELFRTKGVKQTMEITGKAERTIRRYVAEAREIERRAD